MFAPPTPPGGPAPTGPTAAPQGGGTQEAQAAVLAQSLAQQQVAQARDMFSTVARQLVELSQQFPNLSSQLEQLASGVMQLGAQAISELQVSPIGPGV